MKTRNFVAITISIAVVIGLLIYLREYATQDQVTLYSVLLLQLGIWIPWIIGFKIFLFISLLPLGEIPINLQAV